MVELIVPAPPITGTRESNATKDKEGQVYVRDKDKQKVTWIQETISAHPLPSLAFDKSPGNFEPLVSLESTDITIPNTTDLDIAIAKRNGVRFYIQHPISNYCVLLSFVFLL